MRIVLFAILGAALFSGCLAAAADDVPAPERRAAEARGKVCGVLTDQDLQPVQGATVKVVATGAEGTTDRIGKYCLRLAQGPFTLHVDEGRLEYDVNCNASGERAQCRHAPVN